MSLWWVRHYARAIAAILLLLFVCQLPHRGQEDERCAPVASDSGDVAHTLSGNPAPEGKDHCAVCHLFRSVKNALSSARAQILLESLGSRIEAYDPCRVRSATNGNLPARAPPLTSSDGIA